MKRYLFFVFLLFDLVGFSQATLNNFKYVLVPARFEFFNEDDKYGLNTTAKALLSQKGFTVFIGNDALPPEVAANKCGALRLELVQRKGLFATNLTFFLKDCQGNIVFKSKEGKSREKEFPVAFDLAFRDAFTSLKDAPYQYDGTVFTQTQQIGQAPATPPSTPPAVPPATTPTIPSAPSSTTMPSSPTSSGSTPVSSLGGEISGTLYAQIIPNGYQVIDTSPKKVMVLLKTSAPDYFIAEAGPAHGVVFKKNGEWYFEYYKDSQLVSQKLEIKF